MKKLLLLIGFCWTIVADGRPRLTKVQRLQLCEVASRAFPFRVIDRETYYIVVARKSKVRLKVDKKNGNYMGLPPELASGLDKHLEYFLSKETKRRTPLDDEEAVQELIVLLDKRK